MSSYSKRAKSLKRTHRERGQLGSRKHLGLLEKHKDYVLRAKDYHRKQAHLKLLHEKARNRNPDEFYHKMVNTKLKGGRHVIAQPEEKYSPEELQLMKTQDMKYVQMKLSTEKKKIERLQATLHRTSTEKPNSHIVFVDSADQDTGDSITPLVGSSAVDKGAGSGSGSSSGQGGHMTAECARSYKELKQRMHRCKELDRVVRKMTVKKQLMDNSKCVKIPGKDGKPATYKWKKERKR